ncbi:USP domain-containing protein [Plasmodiophora brassicae]
MTTRVAILAATARQWVAAHAVPVIGVLALTAVATCVTIAVAINHGKSASPSGHPVPPVQNQPPSLPPTFAARILRNPAVQAAAGGFPLLALSGLSEYGNVPVPAVERWLSVTCGGKCKAALLAAAVTIVPATIGAYRFTSQSSRQEKQETPHPPAPQEASDALAAPVSAQPVDRPWPTGIKNLGATCYSNSIMQMLSGIDPVVDYVLSINGSALSKLPPTMQQVVATLQVVMSHVTNPSAEVVSAEDSQSMFGAMKSAAKAGAFAHSLNDEFVDEMVTERQCAREYLMMFVKPLLGAIEAGPHWNRALQFSLTREWISQDRQYHEVVPFPNGQQTHLDLNFCRNCSSLIGCILDNGLTTTTTIPRSFGRHNIITSQTIVDDREGGDAPRVVEVEIKQAGTARDYLENAPPYLLIQTTRVYRIGGEPQVKVRRQVHIPDLLDMSPFAMDGFDADDVQYRLLSAVLHLGDTADGGHYIAIKRERYNGQWWLIDDDRVQKMSGYDDIVDPKSSATVLDSSTFLLYERQKRRLTAEDI